MDYQCPARDFTLTRVSSCQGLWPLPGEHTVEFDRVPYRRQATNAAAYPSVDSGAVRRNGLVQNGGQPAHLPRHCVRYPHHQRRGPVHAGKRALPGHDRIAISPQDHQRRRREVLVERGGKAHKTAGLTLQPRVEELQRPLDGIEVARLADQMAETLQRNSGLVCVEGSEGAKLLPGCVYVAPGDNHMVVKGRGGPIAILQTPPENFCRPAVDPMFRSLAAAYGPAVLAVVLTGMGADGREGARAIAGAGGTILAQDEATSVVWGMPAAVVHAGLASAVLPLESVAGEVRKYLGLKRR